MNFELSLALKAYSVPVCCIMRLQILYLQLMLALELIDLEENYSTLRDAKVAESSFVETQSRHATEERTV